MTSRHRTNFLSKKISMYSGELKTHLQNDFLNSCSIPAIKAIFSGSFDDHKKRPLSVYYIISSNFLVTYQSRMRRLPSPGGTGTCRSADAAHFLWNIQAADSDYIPLTSITSLHNCTEKFIAQSSMQIQIVQMFVVSIECPHIKSALHIIFNSFNWLLFYIYT